MFAVASSMSEVVKVITLSTGMIVHGSNAGDVNEFTVQDFFCIRHDKAVQA